MADTAATPSTPAAEAPKTPEAAPWGDDFDAARAWKLVQNLRTEKDELKLDRDRIKSALQASETSTASESEKIAAAETRAKEAEKALYLERIYRQHPELDNDDLRDFLTGDTEDEITAKAERLARLSKAPEADGDPVTPPAGTDAPAPGSGAPEVPGKPTPSLVPGHGGDETPTFDPVAIAKAARR